MFADKTHNISNLSLIFGATGSIGNYIFTSIGNEGYNVYGTKTKLTRVTQENIN
jgi:GDP-D-mannose dehydratase